MTTPSAPPPADRPADGDGDPTLGRLVHDLSEQTRELVRGEMALARAELTDTVKHAGKGAGLFGAAGVVALYGVAVLLAAVVAALALVLPVWAAALLVAVVLLAGAGLAAVLGKKQVDQAAPAVPATQANVQRDVATLQQGKRRSDAPTDSTTTAQEARHE